MKTREPIPQYEIPLDGDTFRLVQERGNDAERIEREAREAEETRRAAEEFARRHQITFA